MSESQFVADPASYIGNKQLTVDTIVADLTGSKTTELVVQVQEQDNDFKTIPQAIDYTQLTPEACSRTMYLRKDSFGQFFMARSSDPKVSEIPLDSYYLPWKNGQAYALRLDNKKDFFCTAKVNGCCIIVSGDRESPLVMHLNYDPKGTRLTPSKQDVDGMSHEQLLEAYKKHQFKQYTRFYGNLAHELIDDNVLDSKKPISVYDPEFYLAGGSFATMFGIRKDNKWTFYFNQRKGNKHVTAELWPAIVGRMP